MSSFQKVVDKYLFWISIPKVLRPTDVVEILIITFLVYQIIVWIKNTKAWNLLKGIIVIMTFILIASIFRMNTILWIAKNFINVAIIAVVIVFQPELRKALEQLGRKNFFQNIITFDMQRNVAELFSDKTINEITKACFEMGKVKTGALIVIEQNNSLLEYERTGIVVDGLVTSQLLINIFEHNTPLHDGAVIIRNNRLTSATCYLPLSDNTELSKELGTRHRAGIGISEVTDSLTIIVSEETGRISVAYQGDLFRNVNSDFVREKLTVLQNKTSEDKKFKLWKGRSKK